MFWLRSIVYCRVITFPRRAVAGQQTRTDQNNQVENPSYLRPPPGADPSLMGPPNIPAAQNAINTLPLSADTRARLSTALNEVKRLREQVGA